ncbi:MAG: response regulator [bacterium]|nr:response regulator [bacterium]
MATILVVEDNEMNLDMLSRRLSKRGHEVLIATDGAQGVEMAQRQKPKLILMDMSLPVMDGWQATRLIKADPSVKHIPIIALTAHAIAGDREKCLAAGCDEYETKPIKFPELLAKIDHFLGISNE